MMVICNDIVIIDHVKRRPGLPNELVVTKHDNNRTEESTVISLNIQYNPYIFTYWGTQGGSVTITLVRAPPPRLPCSRRVSLESL